MQCNKHKNEIVLHAFSKGKCRKCNRTIHSAHIPCDKICQSCSDEYNLCKICGDKLIRIKVQ